MNQQTSTITKTETEMTKQMTVREIRKVLFDTEYCICTQWKEMTNKEGRDFLYEFENQELILNVNVIDNDTHLYIWRE